MPMFPVCRCFTMPSSRLVSVSLDQRDPRCRHAFRSGDGWRDGADLLGWCQGGDEKSASREQKNEGRGEKRRNANQPTTNKHPAAIARQVSVPFSHHTDPSSYIKEYTLYESYTSSHGPPNKRRADQRAPGGDRVREDRKIQNERAPKTEVASDEPRQGFGYCHGSTARRMPDVYHEDDDRKTSGQQETESAGESQPLVIECSQSQSEGRSSVTTARQQQREQQQREQQQREQQRVQHNKSQNAVSQQQQAAAAAAAIRGGMPRERQGRRQKKTKLSISVRGGLELGVKGRGPPVYDTLDEYYARQLERQLIDTIQQARGVLRNSRAGVQKSDDASDTWRANDASDIWRANDASDIWRAKLATDSRKVGAGETDVVEDEVDECDAGRSRVNDAGTRTRRQGKEQAPTGGDTVKLPALPSDCSCLRTKGATRARRQNAKNALQTSKSVDTAEPPTGGVQRAIGAQNGPSRGARAERDNGADVRQSMPSLAGMYSSPDMPARVGHSSSVVLPKLHKWLSDSALSEWLSNNGKPPSKDNNTRAFSREFLDYASALKNKDIFVMLRGVHDQKKSVKRSVARPARSLPSSRQSLAAAKLLSTPAIVGPPPNTPVTAERRVNRHQANPSDTNRHQANPSDTNRHQQHPSDNNRHQQHPSDTSSNQPNPSDTSRHQPHPSDTSRHQPHPSDTNRHQQHPSDTSSNQPNPSDTSRHQANPSDTNRHQPNPSDTSSNQPNPSDTSRHQPNPSDTSRHQPHPSDTNRHQPNPSDTNRHQQHPSDTNRHQQHPSDTNSNQPHPSDTSSNQPNPSDNDSNRHQPNPSDNDTNRHQPHPSDTNRHQQHPSDTSSNELPAINTTQHHQASNSTLVLHPESAAVAKPAIRNDLRGSRRKNGLDNERLRLSLVEPNLNVIKHISEEMESSTLDAHKFKSRGHPVQSVTTKMTSKQ